MLVRLIVFVVLVSLLVFVYRKFTAAKQSNKPVANTTSMKKCAHCGVHLPESESYQHDGLHFCGKEHQQAYLDQHQDD
jgi:uncharacterized protein